MRANYTVQISQPLSQPLEAQMVADTTLRKCTFVLTYFPNTHGVNLVVCNSGSSKLLMI